MRCVLLSISGGSFFALTQTIVNELLDIFVGDECILAPIVRELLDAGDIFRLSIDDFDQARTLAVRMQGETARVELRVV